MIDNTKKDYKQRNHNIAISFSNGYFLNADYILAVEGITDKNFYQKFTNLKILPSPEITNATKIKIDCRSKILKAIYEKKSKGMHWFGIMDSDYSLPEIPPDIEIEKDIIFTDANSLETMLVKYAGIDNFEKKIKDIIYNLQNKKHSYQENSELGKNYCLDKNIVLLALEFSFRIGCLRKKNDENKLNLNFKELSNCYYDFLRYSESKKGLDHDKLKYTVNFDFDSYRNKLIKESSVNEFVKFGLETVETETFSIENSNWIDYCQGHDIIHFLFAILEIHRQITNKKDFNLTEEEFISNIIESYKKKWFSNSQIAIWLEGKVKK